MFDYLEGGESLDEFLRQFPSVRHDQANCGARLGARFPASRCGIANGKLLCRASRGYGAFITMDRNIEYWQNVSALPLRSSRGACPFHPPHSFAAACARDSGCIDSFGARPVTTCRRLTGRLPSPRSASGDARVVCVVARMNRKLTITVSEAVYEGALPPG